MYYGLQKNISRFGTILCRLAVLASVVGFGLLASQLLGALICLLLALIGLMSLCILFFNEDFRRLFDVANSFNDLFAKAQAFFPMIIGISLALLVCGFICQIVDYKDSHTRIKLILYGGCIILLSILFAVLMIGGFVHA